jgi:exopolysaccharide biosynthesis polyprenyl glycosylphosphotransferase
MFRRQILLDSLKVFDLALVVASFASAMLVVSSGLEIGSFERLFTMRIRLQNVAIFLGFIVAWRITFSLFQLYRSHRLSSIYQEALDITKATFAGTAILLVGAYLFNIRLVTTGFIVFFWGVATTSTIISRLLLRTILRQLRLHGRNLRNVIIVGANSRALGYAKILQSRPDLGYTVKGFVDNEDRSEEAEKAGYALLANLEGFPDFLRHSVVDEVVIALPMKSLYQQAARIAALCEEQGVTTRFLTDLFNTKIGKARAEHIGDQAVTTITTGGMEGLARAIKRLLDVLVACVALILLSPFFLMVTVLIKATSSGPVFFIQRRVGVNKRLFKLYKFRTMVVDAEKQISELEHLNEVKGPAFKIKHDPRINPIGRFLRKMSIDELPQLLNVLKGDMSLVGPRPLPIRDYNGFDEDWHRRRFSVRPGITCLWQINGRSNVSFDHWMALDMEYIDRWSLWLDFKILIQTIPAVLKGSGAA